MKLKMSRIILGVTHTTGAKEFIEGEAMLSQELREKVNQTILRAISIRDLENWLVPRQESLIAKPNSADADVVSAIELGLAELHSHIRNEKDFTDYLLQVLLEHQFARPVMTNQATVIFNSTGTAVPDIATQAYVQREGQPATVQWVVG